MTADENAKPTQPEKLIDLSHRDIETDAAVIGYGVAVSCAAIEA